EVDDPSPFGVADLDAAGRIQRFVEKPPRELAPSRFINSGSWLFEPSLLADMDASRFNRVEDELFPNVCAQGRPVYGYMHAGYWADVGNPAALLRVNLDLVRQKTPDGVLLDEGVAIDLGGYVEAPVVIGARARIASGAIVARSVLWDDVTIETGATVRGSTIASGVVIGAHAEVIDSVIAHGAIVEAGAHLTGVAIEPAPNVAEAAR
ncbi:MAG: NDP-sugar synthase, partial [Chloroflexota bacterium]